MYSDAVAIQLRAHGYDVVSVREVSPSLAGIPDAEVLGAAVTQKRSLVTENVRDYRRLEASLLAEAGHHHGIVYTTDRQFPRGSAQTTGRLVTALAKLLSRSPALADRSIFLRPA